MKHWAWALALSIGQAGHAAISPVSQGLLDDATGLQWLSLGPTRAFTWEMCSTLFPEYRMASSTDVATLFAHAGIEGTHGDGLNEGARSLLLSWGALSGDHGSIDSTFWVSDSRDGMRAVGTLAQSFVIATGQPHSWIADPGVQWFVADEGVTWRGAALVREVPEPSTWALMLAGLIAVSPALPKRSYRTPRPA